MSLKMEPVAVVDGKPVEELPTSLYLPPEALRVILDSFEGPLDLLHYLIRRNNMDILDIPMEELTKQYLVYVDKIVGSDIELVADYLLMSATLIEIKSRSLLPKQNSQIEQEEDDPRKALVERLLIYGKIRGAAEHLRQSDVQGRDYWYAGVTPPKHTAVQPRVSCQMLLQALLHAEERKEVASELSYTTDTFSVRDAMSHVLIKLRSAKLWIFSNLFTSMTPSKVRIGTVFIAMLQLAKEQIIRIDQDKKSNIKISSRDN